MSGPSYETKWMLTDQVITLTSVTLNMELILEIERNRYFKIFSMWKT